MKQQGRDKILPINEAQNTRQETRTQNKEGMKKGKEKEKEVFFDESNNIVGQLQLLSIIKNKNKKYKRKKNNNKNNKKERQKNKYSMKLVNLTQIGNIQEKPRILTQEITKTYDKAQYQDM